MTDKLSIIINTILNAKQEDLQRQIDSISKKLQINLKPRIDFNENEIAKLKNDIEKLSKSIKLNLQFGIDNQSIKNAEKTVSDISNKISEKTKSNDTKLKIFNKEELDAEGRQYFLGVNDIINKVKNEFKDLGDVNVRVFENAQKQITGFEAEVKKLDGTIEKLKFDLADIRIGDDQQQGFVFSGATLFDKNAGDVLQKNLNILQDFETKLNNIRDNFTSLRGVKDPVNLGILNKEYTNILTTIEKLKTSQINLTEEQKRSIERQINNLRSLSKVYRDIEITAEKGFNFKQFKDVTGQIIQIRENLEAQITTLNNYQEALSKPLLEGFKLIKLTSQETEKYLKVTQELQKGNEFVTYSAYVDKATNSIHEYSHSSRNAMIETLTLSKAIKTAIIRMGEWAIAGTLIFGTLKKIREGIQYIHELDDAIVDLTKVVDLSNQQINEMAQSAIDLGKKLGKSSVDIMDSMAEFGRITKDTSEIIELTRVATMASNVTTMSAAEAAKALTSAMVTFGISAKDSMVILDAWNEIQNNFRVSAEDMAASISKVGSASKIAKTDMQTLMGIITSIIQSTGISGDEAGTAVKSFISRIFRTDESDIETLGKTAKAFKEIANIDFIDANKELKSFGDIIAETASKWEYLSEQDKMALAQSVGSTYHYSKFIALMENYQTAIDATAKAYASEGSAINENQKYLDSITGRLQVLNTTWQDFANSILSSSVFKSLISFLTGIVNGLNTVPGKIMLIVSSVTLLTMAIITFKTQVVAAGIAVKGFLTSLGPIGWVTLAISTLTTVVLGVANAFSEAKKSQEEFMQTTKQQIKELEQETELAKNLYDTYTTAAKGTQEFNDARRKLAETFPSLIVGFDNEGEAILANNEAIKEQIELLKQQAEEKRKLLQETAEDTIRKEQKKVDELRKEVESIEKYIEELKYSRDNADELGTALTRAEIIAYSNEQIAVSYKKLDEKGKELRETLGTLRETYVALAPPMDDLSEAQKKVANDFIDSAVAEQKYIEQGNFNRKAFIKGYIEAINNVELLKKAEAELAEQSKKTSQGSFENLLKSISDTSKELKTLNQVIADVRNGQSLSAEKILDLIENYDLSADAIKKTSDGYTVELSALENVRKAKIQTALDGIENEKKHALEVKEQVKSRLKNYGLEIEQLKNIAEVKKKLAEQADKEASQRANEIAAEYSDVGIRNGIYTHIRNRIYTQVYNEYMNKAGADVDLARQTLADIEELEKKSKLLISILNDESYGVSSSKSSSSKSTQFSEQFDFINTKIKSLNQELKELQQQLDDTFSPADKQTIIDKMIVAQQKKADLLKKAIKTYEDSAQKELQKIPESLRSAVVSGSFNMAIISEKTYGEKRAKEISEAIKQYQSLTDTIIGLKNEYTEIDNTIRSLNLDKITLSFEIFDKKIRESDRALEELDYQLNLLKDNDYDKKAEILTKKIEIATKQVNEYEQELERLKAIVPANAEEAEKLQERIDELTKKFREGKISIKEYNDTFEETAKNLISTLLNTQKDIDKKNLENQLKEREKQIYDITEAEFEAYKKAKIESLKKQKEENEKFATEEAKELVRLLTEQIKLEEGISYKDIVNFNDLYKEIHNEKIKQYQDTIDMLERSNELEQQRLEREERILEIQELQLKLQNTLNNRNVQILRKKEDGSWEYDYVADPEKVEELQKQIEEKQKDFDEWERNNSLKQIKELLQQKIEQEQELIRISEETYNRIAEIETTKFNEHYENMDILAENMLDSLKNTYNNKWDEIINVLKEKVSIAEREYAKLLGASVAGVSVQIPNRNIAVQTPSTGFGTTPTAESEAYARQLKEAVGGDREAFRQAEIARAEQVIANRKAQGLDTSAQEAYLDSLLKNTFKFKEGGLVDFTGLAWVDGSKTKPEAFLNPTQTKLIDKLADSLPNMANILNNFAITKMKLPSLSKISNNKEVKQIFNISKLEFPNVRTADEIKAAILDLPRLSLQSAKAY